VNKLVRFFLVTTAFAATFAVVANAQQHDDPMACPHRDGECSRGSGDHAASDQTTSRDDATLSAKVETAVAALAPVVDSASTGVEASEEEHEPGSEDCLAAHDGGACAHEGSGHSNSP